MRYISSPDFHRDSAERIGILLVNSGTPVAPQPWAVRQFLARMLSDPRVVELPRPLWLPILYGLILPLRPRRVAAKYRRIWSHSRLAAARHLGAAAHRADSAPWRSGCWRRSRWSSACSTARPPVPQALARLREAGAQRILVLPLFPQYCGATTGAAYDRVTAELKRWRWLPELRFVAEYHDQPEYIEALRASVLEHWQAHGRTRHLLISFHGIPERNFHQRRSVLLQVSEDRAPARGGAAAARRGVERELPVALRAGGMAEALHERVLAQLPGRGVREVTVVCPGFAIDCLETLEEIAIENRDIFLRAGGQRFEYVPALNDRAAHARVSRQPHRAPLPGLDLV